MPASNKTATYLMYLVFLVVAYVTATFMPPWWDNQEFKQVARARISASRDEQQAERAHRNFLTNVRGLGIAIPEDACTYERATDNGGRMRCDYVREVTYPLTSKVYRWRFTWTVTQNFQY